nr:hypothetical protein [Tanacetum cinerariifolium]
MGDENPIRTLGDYSKPSHEGYRNTIELPVGNNVDDMIGKINILWKTIFEKLDDVSTLRNAGNSMAPKSIASISHVEREELRKKGIKSPSKLFFPKYLSSASIKELNKNFSALKCVHFVNLIIILSKDSDTKEEDVLSTNAHEHELEREFVFGKPFIEEISLVYNKKEGTITFSMDNKKIYFKIPHTMEIFKQTRLMGLSIDSIPSSAYEENFGNGRTHYYQSLHIRDEYKHDGDERRGIRHLMRLEKEMMGQKGESRKNM